MNCAQRDRCRRRADVVVDCGERLLAVLCGRCAAIGAARHGWRILRELAGRDEPVTMRPRGA